MSAMRQLADVGLLQIVDMAVEFARKTALGIGLQKQPLQIGGVVNDT